MQDAFTLDLAHRYLYAEVWLLIDLISDADKYQMLCKALFKCFFSPQIIFFPFCSFLHFCIVGIKKIQWEWTVIRYFKLLFVCLCVVVSCHGHAWFIQRPEEGVKSSGARVTESHEPPCGHRELRLGLLWKRLNFSNCWAISPILLRCFYLIALTKHLPCSGP